MPKKSRTRKRSKKQPPAVSKTLSSPQNPKMSENQEPQPQSPGHSEDQSQLLPNQQAVVQSQDAAISPPPLPAPGGKPPSPPSRKPPGKRRKPISEKKRAAIQKKLTFLERNLQPVVPFPHGKKTLNFSNHERLFRSLGLWDFLHLKLDCEIRSDLLASLIANYDPRIYCSFVNGVRVAVNRASLARALNLPVKKEKVSSLESKDLDTGLFAEEESVAAILDFMSNWVLFHGDACILPEEVVSATRLVKEWQPQKVDWAKLIWTMVEKELSEITSTGMCYYASHLQCLMRHQKPGLFKGVVEEEPSMEVPLIEEEEEVAACGGAMSAKNVEDFGYPDYEKQGDGLSLEIAPGEDLMEEDAGECKDKEEDREPWFQGEKNEEGGQFLRPCNLYDIHSMEYEDVRKEGGSGVGEEESYAEDLTSKFQIDLLHTMDTVNVSFCPMQTLSPSSGEFLASRANTIKSVDLNPCPGGPSSFGNTSKRVFGDMDNDDEDGDVQHFPHDDQQKRMRNDGPWNEIPSTFDECMHQVQYWTGKTKMMFAEKEQECMDAQLQVQRLNRMLLEKEHLIKSLENSIFEEQQKRQVVLCQFEHELRVMTRIMLGYKKALEETRRAFAEYRKKFPQGEEPLYKDVGAGGVVVSTRELERQRLEREEIKRNMATQMCNDLLKEWCVKCGGFADRIQHMAKRLPKLEEEYILLKELRTKNKCSEKIPE